MLKMSSTPISATQKPINLVDEFGDCDENEVRKTSTLTKGTTGADYLSSNQFSHIVSISAKNIRNYLILDAKRAFDQLRQAFTKAPIRQHFDPEWYIRIKIDASGYAISGVVSQLTNNLSQWYPLAYYSWKMIPTKTKYKTYNGKLLAIVKVFKKWWHYLESCKHKVFIFYQL